MDFFFLLNSTMDLSLGGSYMSNNEKDIKITGTHEFFFFFGEGLGFYN